MRASQSKWDPSDDIVKSKSCFDRIFYSQKVYVKPITSKHSKPLKPVAQKLKLSKNYSNQKPTSSRSLKSLKFKPSSNKKQINLEEIKKRFCQAKNIRNSQHKNLQISVSPYLTANTLQTSLASFKIYDQRQNIQNMFSSRRYSTINSNRQNFQESDVSLKAINQKNNSNDLQYQIKEAKYYTPESDKYLLSSTRINTINSSASAFASRNSFYKDQIRINQEKSDEDMSILLENSSKIQDQIHAQEQKIFQFEKQEKISSLLPKNKGLLSPGRIRLISARQVQTIESIKTQESLVSQIQLQQSQGRNSQTGSNIFHRILALKKY